MTTPLLLVALPVLLLGAAIAVSLRSNVASAAAAIISQTIATAFAISTIVPILAGDGPIEVVQPWPRPIESIVFRIDALSAFFLAWSLPLTLLGTIYATGYLKPYFAKGRSGGPHYALLNMTSLAFVLIYSVQNALVFLLGWEVAAVAAWLLVIWDYRNQKIRFAGFNYLVSTHVGLFVLVAAFMLLHSHTGSMDFRAFGDFLSKESSIRDTIFLLLGVSFALKSAFFPFHTWLPRAHSAAPAHVSALMSGVIHKAGLFAFLRFTLLMGRPEEWMGFTVLGFGMCSAFFGVLYSSTQRDLKRLLGYSSTENVGIAAMGFGVGYLGWAWNIPSLALCGFAGGLLHILNHALFKCLLFYAAGSVYRATHTVDIERLGGLAKKLPRTTVLFLVGALAICALPPLNGFVSEFFIYSGLLGGKVPDSQSNVMLIGAAAVLAFVGAVSALSMTRAFGIAFLGTSREPEHHAHYEEPPSMTTPMWIHAALVVLIGVAPQIALAGLKSTLVLFPIGGLGEDVAAPLAAVVWPCRVLALALLTVGIWSWRKGIAARRSATWGCGYNAANTRMQYTGSSFIDHFAHVFEAFLPAVKRERIPNEIFPQQPGHLATHHADPVEKRMFEVLGQGEDFVVHATEKLPEEPRFAFAAAFVLLIVIAVMIAGGHAQ